MSTYLRDPHYRTVLLVGECNPYSEHPEHSLLPWPRNAAGDRLSRILGLTHREYLGRFARLNLCVLAWNLREARAEADRISRGFRCPVLLLGARPCAAFGVPYRPFEVVREGMQPVAVLPHPSGRCRIWSRRDSRERARALVERLRTERWASLLGVPRDATEVL